MKSVLPNPRFFVILSIILIYLSSVVSPANAQVQGAQSPEVVATVGDLYLNVSGYQSPFASIVMKDLNGNFMRSVVADAQGNFSMTEILINTGFAGFCLTAVDFKQIGESVTCFNFTPATADITMTDLFLPPTLGLSRTQIDQGGSAQAFGYTMPGATVTLHISNGTTLITTADNAGYYVFEIQNLPTGTYDIYATATYQSKDSLNPSNKLQIQVLSLTGKGVTALRNFWQTLFEFLKKFGFWLLLLVLLGLILWLLHKLWPDKFTFIHTSKLFALLPRKHEKKLLHHAWFVGY